MTRFLSLTALALVACTTSVNAAGITGKYIEARTCDVWTGPCFANAEMNLGGKHAILGWSVEKGELNGVSLNGLSIVAVVAASDTLGLQQTGSAKAILIVDSRATSAQHDALVLMAKKQGGELLKNVVGITSSTVNLDICTCEEGGCGKLNAGVARIETRCLDSKHDKVCGNESPFYPPLSKGVTVKAAMAVENKFSGKGVNETWSDAGRRGAYLGTFEAR